MANKQPPAKTRSRVSLRSRFNDRVLDMTPIERVLWAVVAISAIVVIVIQSVLSPKAGSPSLAPTQVAQFSSPTRSPSPTPVPSATPTPRSLLLPTLEPLAIPTPPSAGEVLTFSPDPDRTGWVGSNDQAVRWRDRNLYTGIYQGQVLYSLVEFDLTSLAPGSKILYAALELTRRDAKSLGKDGEWRIDLVQLVPGSDWDNAGYDVVRGATSLAVLGTPLTAQNLAGQQITRVILDPNQLSLLQKELDAGTVSIRLSGPSQGNDNRFTWDAGPGIGEPTLYIVAIPASFVYVTATPTPGDIYTAATMIAQQKLQAARFGTPTPLPRLYSIIAPNSTPAGFVAVTNVPTPLNQATTMARLAYATAVAATTGTFTPTPPNFVTVTPTPRFLALTQFTPGPTPTLVPTPVEISLVEYRKTPIPKESGLIGQIAFKTERDGGAPQVWVMDPNGVPVGKLTGMDYYQIATVHDLYSPDWNLHLDFDKDARDKWQIVVYDIRSGKFSPMIQELSLVGQGVYHPAWSPDGSKIAYVSNSTTNSEIWVYDIQIKSRKRLTWHSYDSDRAIWTDCKHPSWSPDGKQIVYALFNSTSNLRNSWQIWIMDADGGNQRALSPSQFNDYDPVWIKR